MREEAFRESTQAARVETGTQTCASIAHSSTAKSSGLTYGQSLTDNLQEDIVIAKTKTNKY